jgi:hypothetical protein
MRVKEEFFERGAFILGDGANIRFWEDKWLGDRPLATQYPLLYNIVRHKNQTVAHTFASTPINIEFRRSLVGGRWDTWLHLLHRLIDVRLETKEDEFRWSLTQSRKFTVKSMYLHLLNDNTVYLHKYLWKLYNIVRHKNQTVAHTFASTPINIEFRRSLVGGRWDTWLHLLHRLIDVRLEPKEDEFRWSLTQSRKFTVKSVYLHLLNDNTVYLHKYLWKMKVPLKTKIFMWFVHRKDILTKDNLLKRNWQGSSKCCFCDHDETVQHLFVKCPFAKIIWQIVYMAFNITPPLCISHMFGNWLDGVVKSEKLNIRVGVCAIITAIWYVRNEFIFNKSYFPTFLQVIPLAIHWIHMWSYRPEEQRRNMDIGCNRLETVARDIYSRFGWRFDGRVTC